jgi:hypothetical protein
MDGFLRTIKDLSTEEAAAATGINYESIRLYRKDEWQKLAAGTQRKMRKYLGKPPAGDGEGYARGLLFAAAEMEKKASELRALATSPPGDEPDRIGDDHRDARGGKPPGPKDP